MDNETTLEYDTNLNKPLDIPIGNSSEQGVVQNVSVSNVGGGAIQTAWKFGKDGSIQMFETPTTLSIYIGF